MSEVKNEQNLKEEIETPEESKKKKTSKPKSSAKRKPKKNKDQEQISALKETVERLEKEVAEAKDKALRKAAEFENFKRRTEKEFIDHLELANEGLIKELIPVVDDFERSAAHTNDGADLKDLIEGVELIYKKLMGVLEKKGLKVMKSVGEEFNPDMHSALMQIEVEDKDSGIVVEEHAKGYKLGDKVIRHSQVIVSK
jgi:molecular chaperone GrpE